MCGDFGKCQHVAAERLQSGIVDLLGNADRADGREGLVFGIRQGDDDGGDGRREIAAIYRKACLAAMVQPGGLAWRIFLNQRFISALCRRLCAVRQRLTAPVNNGSL